MTGGVEVKKTSEDRKRKKEKELGVFLCAWRLANSFSRKSNKKMMERKGEKESSVILGKGQGFLYFIWLIVLRRFLIRSVSLRLECIQCGCTIFGALIFYCVSTVIL